MSTQSIFPAVESGDGQTVRPLLDVDPGLVHVRRKEDGMSPLQLAAKLGLLEICRLLVERGAEVYPNPMATYPPVMEAAWAKHQRVVDYFLKEIPDKAQGTNGLGVTINLAGRMGWSDIVRRHIERDPLAVHQRGWIGDTPLHWPAHNDCVEIVQMLLDAGAVVDAHELNWIGGTPLQWASEHAPSTTKLLLAHGADPNSRNVMEGSPFIGVTPLIMNATQKDDCAEVADLLLAAGADIHARDATGRSALDHAQERGLTHIIEVLLWHRAQ